MLQLRRGLKDLPIQAFSADLQSLCCWLSNSNPGSPEHGFPLSPARNVNDHRGQLIWRPQGLEEGQQGPSRGPVPQEDLDMAQQIWSYMNMGHEVKKSDVILVLGNNDLRVAEYAAQLYNEGLGTWLLLSGRDGNLTRGKWKISEAEAFKQVAIQAGVPSERILIEDQATNTGENIKYSYHILQERHIPVESIILVQCPYMERRTYATFMKQWPAQDDVMNRLDVRVTSPPISMLDYPNSEVGDLRDVICIMLGCLQRIVIYPRIGYQIAQEVPEQVKESYLQLVSKERYNDFIVTV